MKRVETISRVLLGLLLLFSFVTYVFNLFPPPAFEGDAKLFYLGVEASGYLMVVIKSIEVTVAVLLLWGRYVSLAALLLAPLAVNILLFHLFLVPEGLPVAIVVLVGWALLMYQHREKYKLLLS